MSSHAPQSTRARATCGRPNAPPSPSPPQLRLHVLELDRHPEALQLGDDLFAAATARGARGAQELLQSLVFIRQEHRQDVQLTPGSADAELAAGNDADAELRRLVLRVGDAVRRVVIGERDSREVHGAGAPGDLRWRTLAVGGGRMTMQINVRRNRSRERSTPAATRGTAQAARGPTALRRHGPATERRVANSA